MAIDRKLSVMALGMLLALIPNVSSATAVTFRNGDNGYTGTQDTELREDQPGTNFGANPNLTIDGKDGGDDSATNALIRFDDIFGSATGQIPFGSTITSASLGLQIHSPGDNLVMLLMLVDWAEDTAKWVDFNAGGAGLQDFSGEASFLRNLLNLDSGSVTDEVTVYEIDVAAELQLWSDGTANYGWGFTPTGNDGVDFHTSEHPSDGHIKPTLVVNFDAPATNGDLGDIVAVPEPSTLGLMMFGLVALGLRLKQRA